jgi:hypothetical protein
MPKLFVITFMYHVQKDGQQTRIWLELVEIHSLLHTTHFIFRVLWHWLEKLKIEMNLQPFDLHINV